MINAIGNFIGNPQTSSYNPLTAFEPFDVIWFDPREEDMAIVSGEIAVWYDRGNNGGNNATEGGGTNLVFGSGFRPTLETDGDGINYVALEDDSAALTFFNWGINAGYYYIIGVFDYDGAASPAEGGRILQLSSPSTVMYLPLAAANTTYGVLVNGGSTSGGNILSPSGKVLYELDLTTTTAIGRVNESQVYSRAYVAQTFNSSAAAFSATTSPSTGNTFFGKCYGLMLVKGQLTDAEKTTLRTFLYTTKQLTY